MKPLVIITDNVHPYLVDVLHQNNFEVLQNSSITKEELLDKIPAATGLILTTRIKINQQVIDVATHLKWIGRLGSGMEHIDVNYAESKGIKCISTPEGNSNAVAEHVIGLILSLLNNINISHIQIKNGVWLRNENRGTELTGKTVGIIGYGHTGSMLAKRLSGFDVTVLAHDKYKQGFGNGYIKEASLEELCAKSHVISLHLPLTAETTYYANEVFFNQLSLQPLFINASRGRVTHTRALLDALKNYKITGAGLDVLENEKLATYTLEEQEYLNQLLAMPNVVITPHIAGYSHEAFFRMSRNLLEKLGLL